MTPEHLNQITQWSRDLYRRRTEALDQGVGRIDWVDPGTRVCLTEVRTYAASIGVTLDVNDVRDLLEALQ